MTSLEPRTLHQPEKLQNVSKNEYVFTPFIFIVNTFSRSLNRLLSIKCSPCTGRCRRKCAAAAIIVEIISIHAVFSRSCRVPNRLAARSHAKSSLCKSSLHPHEFGPSCILGGVRPVSLIPYRRAPAPRRPQPDDKIPMCWAGIPFDSLRSLRAGSARPAAGCDCSHRRSQSELLDKPRRSPRLGG